MTGPESAPTAYRDAIVDASVRAAERTPGLRRADWRVDTVTAVNTDGTVDVGEIRARRLESYTAPRVGDKVMITQNGAGNWLAVGRTASAAAAIGLPQYVYKATHTDRASTTTLVNDPDLQLTLDANAVYRVEFWLHYAAIDLVSSNPAGRFRTAWAVPAGAAGNRSAVGPDQGAILSASSGGQGRWGVHNFDTVTTYGDRNSSTNQCFALEEGVVFTTAGGTLALQWAQAVSNASATRLAQGSYLRVTRLA